MMRLLNLKKRCISARATCRRGGCSARLIDGRETPNAPQSLRKLQPRRRQLQKAICWVTSCCRTGKRLRKARKTKLSTKRTFVNRQTSLLHLSIVCQLVLGSAGFLGLAGGLVPAEDLAALQNARAPLTHFIVICKKAGLTMTNV